MRAAWDLFIEGLQHGYCKIDRVSCIRFVKLPEDSSLLVDEYCLCCGGTGIHTEEHRAGSFRKRSGFRPFPSVPFTEGCKRRFIFKEGRKPLDFLHFRIGEGAELIPQYFHGQGGGAGKYRCIGDFRHCARLSAKARSQQLCLRRRRTGNIRCFRAVVDSPVG